jgi:hypothetical protein
MLLWLKKVEKKKKIVMGSKTKCSKQLKEGWKKKKKKKSCNEKQNN